MNLRDHDAPCEHNNTRAHGWTTPRPGTPPSDFQRYNKGGGDRWTDRHWCDGGAAVSIDYEAAWVYWTKKARPADESVIEMFRGSVDALVDAALGLTDETPLDETDR